MASYYEQLKLPASASTEEITAAIDALYNQWRHLANNPQHSAQAQQQLQLLETMRDTLIDPAKRVGYDVSIGVVGGLIDPAALIAAECHPSPPPGPLNARMKTESRAPATLGANPWACYKCRADNPPKTPFCFQCGAQLVQTCPECNKETSLIATKMCGSCGYNYDVATKRGQLRGQISRLEQQLTNTRTQKVQETNSAGCAIGCGSFILVGLAALAGLYLAATLLGSMEIPAQTINGSLGSPVENTCSVGWFYCITTPFSTSKVAFVTSEKREELFCSF